MEPGNPYNAPTQVAPVTVRQSGARTVCIKKIDMFSAGTMMGALYALIGLIVGGFMSLFAVLGIAAGGGGDAAWGGLIAGAGALVFVPVLYGVLGFIGGILFALLYNIVAALAGGIRIDLEG